jgi:DNA polymerase I-like protein with 3'-5' exonuclease and polymerase domains
VLQTRLGGMPLDYELPWNGTRFRTRTLAIDTETTVEDDPAVIPTLVLMTASDGQRHVVIRPEDVARFFAQHLEHHFVGHHLAYDFWVLVGFFEAQHDSEAIELLWRLAVDNQFFDTMLFDGLLRLGTVGDGAHGHNLADLAADSLGVKLAKEDPFRLRFAELVGADWTKVDVGFFDYAIRDVVVTYLIFEEQCERFESLALSVPNLTTANPATHVGPLSLAIQVQGAIALEKLKYTGIHLDRERLPQLRRALLAERERQLGVLTSDPANAQIFRRDASGEIMLTATGEPRIRCKPLESRFLQAADEIRTSSGFFKVPRTPNRDNVSTAQDAWVEHSDKHPFLNAWFLLKQISKQLQFFEKLQTERVHPRYTCLTRTGRTSCSGPNIQQLPREGGIRECFIPSPGHVFLIVDYAYIELVTLAAICLARFGFSHLAEIIKQGIDPHCYTAALLRGITIEAFMALKQTDPDRFEADRQRAKAINFGIPGGLSAASLANYARLKYGVVMTTEEAEELRTRLIHEIYPEIGLYLYDDPAPALADNLRCSVDDVWGALGIGDDRNLASILGVRRVVAGHTTKLNGAPYSERWLTDVWESLNRLNRNPELAACLAARQGVPELASSLFDKSVSTETGRVRAGATFCQARNTPFQGLAADGAKVALFFLLYAKFRVVAFIHDEFVIEIPEGCDYDRQAHEVTKIMQHAMSLVVGDIPVTCSVAISRCWSKEAKEVRDPSGRLQVWEPA